MEYLIFIGVIVFGIIFWFINGMRMERQRKNKFKSKLLQLEGMLPDKRYEREHFLFVNNHIKEKADGFFIDQITWDDLSMDEIFQRMDYTYSAAGEEVLYRMLHVPVNDQDELKHRNDIIAYFEQNKEDRVKLQLLYAKIGRTGKYSIYEYLDYLQNLEIGSNGKDIIVIILMLVSIGVMFLHTGYGILLFGFLVIYNFISYFKTKKEIDPYITTFSYVIRMLQNARQIAANDIKVIQKEREYIIHTANQFKGFMKGAYLVVRGSSITGNPLDILMDYLCMFLHFDLMKFRTMHKNVSSHNKELKQMFDTVGYIEAMISVALFRKSLRESCIPELKCSDKPEFSITDAYHPLLNNPVTNSISCDKGVLLTGSNASGKSTFLKTIAMNAVLAQTIYTCTAKAYKSSFFRVLSSMSLKDNLIEGDSYFIVEIKAIKRIIEACEKEDAVPVLAFVDEVLRGTNTVERIAASTEILKAIQDKNGMCFAATHDLELTTLLEGYFENYHFEEKLENNDVTFAYKLLPGETKTRNAIELLRVLGFEEKIITNAKGNAIKYLEKEKNWK